MSGATLTARAAATCAVYSGATETDRQRQLSYVAKLLAKLPAGEGYFLLDHDARVERKSAAAALDACDPFVRLVKRDGRGDDDFVAGVRATGRKAHVGELTAFSAAVERHLRDAGLLTDADAERPLRYRAR